MSVAGPPSRPQGRPKDALAPSGGSELGEIGGTSSRARPPGGGERSSLRGDQSVARHFAASYGEARDRFMAACKARGLEVSRHVHPRARGAEGEELSIDVAQLGSPDARGLLLLISGTHGAEGFCGSGAQVALLHDDAVVDAIVRAKVAVLFLHALNPYGFSQLRRTNEDNIDLNRNFRDFSAPRAPAHAYAEIHRYLVPANWPPGPENEQHLAAYAALHGERGLQQAISSGQCQFPDGLFYGGTAPAWSNLVLRGLLREHGARRKALGWLDFHTGLGPRGHGEKIYAGRDVEADIARTKAWWGADVTSFFDGTSMSAVLTGVNAGAVYDECPGVAFAGIALEYGTLPMPEVIGALRADGWLESHSEAPPAQRAAIKQQVRAAFYCDADDWKETVVAQARTATLAALPGLAA